MGKKIDFIKTNEIESFGGRDLKTNLKDVELAISEMDKDFRIHNHSNTQFSWQRFVLSHKGGLRNIRQITAEINKKKLALHEAKHRYTKDVIKIKSLRSKIAESNRSDKYEKMLFEAEINELEEKLELTIGPIEGAIKDILTLKAAYDTILKDWPDYTEEDLEREEIAYWIRRLFSQALRDIRQSGIITTGNQEAIEHIGLNVSHVFLVMKSYLEKEVRINSPSGETLDTFLDACVKEYKQQVTEYSSYGINGKIVDRSLSR